MQMDSMDADSMDSGQNLRSSHHFLRIYAASFIVQSPKHHPLSSACPRIYRMSAKTFPKYISFAYEQPTGLWLAALSKLLAFLLFWIWRHLSHRCPLKYCISAHGSWCLKWIIYFLICLRSEGYHRSSVVHRREVKDQQNRDQGWMVHSIMK